MCHPCLLLILHSNKFRRMTETFLINSEVWLVRNFILHPKSVKCFVLFWFVFSRKIIHRYLFIIVFSYVLFSLVWLSSLDDERDLTSPSHTNSSKDVSSSAVLRSLQVNVCPDGEETRAQNVQKPSELLSSSETSSLLQDLQPSDSTSFILLNLTRAGNSPSVCHLAGYVSDNRMQEIQVHLCPCCLWREKITKFAGHYWIFQHHLIINSFLQCRGQWRLFQCSYYICAMNASLWEAKELSVFPLLHYNSVSWACLFF